MLETLSGDWSKPFGRSTHGEAWLDDLMVFSSRAWQAPSTPFMLLKRMLVVMGVHLRSMFCIAVQSHKIYADITEDPRQPVSPGKRAERDPMGM